MTTTNKIRVLWIVITLISTVLGYLLLMHGGVYGEAAERAGEPAELYQIEINIGLALIWPVTIYGWLRSYLGGSNTLGIESFFFQFIGYGFLYFSHVKYKTHNKKL